MDPAAWREEVARVLAGPLARFSPQEAFDPDAFDLTLLHPEYREVARWYRGFEDAFVEGLRAKLGRPCPPPELPGELTRGMRVAEAQVPRADGSLMRVLLCAPDASAPAPGAKGWPAVLFFHGGGYVAGTPESSVAYARLLVAARLCVVALPEYRLAVEAPFPAASDDACLALRWLARTAPRLGCSADRLAVMGDSAGGGLAVSTCLAAAARGLARPRLLAALYPMLDDRMGTSSASLNRAPAWNTACNRLAWHLYLAGHEGEKDVSPLAAPARAARDQLAGLPPTLVLSGTLDPFFDEDAELVRRARQAGVDARLEAFEGCFHAFDMALPTSGPAARVAGLLREAIRSL